MRRIACMFFCAVWVAVPSAAQETVDDVVGFLVTNQAVITSDIQQDQAAAAAARDTITRALLLNLTSTPLASSSSGFLYRLNPALGTMERASQTFGTFFVERALTAGKGRASVGVSGSTITFNRLDGFHLKDGTLVTIANQYRDEPAPFNTESLRLEVTSRVMTVSAAVGVTDRLEVGAALPLIELGVTGQRNSVYRGTTLLQASGQASASGIGDMAVRGKYTVYAEGPAAAAAAAEVRLPTGEEANLLGAGSASFRVLGIVSYEPGAFAVHGNAGLVRGGISDEATVSGAGSYAVNQRVTLSGELLVRHVAELRQIGLLRAPHPDYSGADTIRLSTLGEGGTTLANIIAGVKWNVGATLVIGGHVGIPLRHRGLTAPITPTVALEFAF